MASNFQILSFKTRDSLYLKLTGDFDGNSAYELINTLTKHSVGFWNIFIDTNNLKTIYPFGRDVFRRNLKRIKKQIKNIIIIGSYKYNFEQDLKWSVH